MSRAVLIFASILIISSQISVVFAQTSTDSGYIYNPNKEIPTPKPYDWCNENGCGYGNPNPTLPPERKCGACLESQTVRTEQPKNDLNTTPTPTSTSTEIPQVQGATVIQPQQPKIVKPKIIPTSASATPSAYPVTTPLEIKPQSLFEKFWLWFIKFLRI